MTRAALGLLRCGLALLVLSPSALAHASETIRYQGTAYDDQGRVVYRERHTNVIEGSHIRRSRTRYFDPEGRLIAELDSEYRFGAALPQYRFVDHRSGLEEGVKRSRSHAVLFRRELRAEPFRTKTLEIKDSMMAGQGLHHFMRENLAQVIRQRRVSLRFLIPGRLDHFGFRVERTAYDRQRVSFRLRVASWLLRIFAGDATFTYERASGRLLAYRGPSNLVDEQGNAQQVRIRYSYASLTPIPANSRPTARRKQQSGEGP